MPPLVYLQKSWQGSVLFELRGRTLRVSSLDKFNRFDSTFDLGEFQSNHQSFQKRFTGPAKILLSIAGVAGWLGYKMLVWDFEWMPLFAVFPFEVALIYFVMAMQSLGKVDFVVFALHKPDQFVRIICARGREADYERFVTELEVRVRLIEAGEDVGEWADRDNEDGMPKITAAAYRMEDADLFSRTSITCFWIAALVCGGLATSLALLPMHNPETAGVAFMLSFIATMLGGTFAVLSWKKRERQDLLAALALLLALMPFVIFLINPSP